MSSNTENKGKVSTEKITKNCETILYKNIEKKEINHIKHQKLLLDPSERGYHDISSEDIHKAKLMLSCHVGFQGILAQDDTEGGGIT